MTKLTLWNDLERQTRDLENFLGFNPNESNVFSVDVYDDDKNLFIEAELPGFDKKDIEMNIENRILTIKAKKEEEKENKEKNYFKKEISSKNYERSFKLPDYLDIENVEANYQNGILKISFSKNKEMIKKQIKIA